MEDVKNAKENHSPESSMPTLLSSQNKDFPNNEAPINQDINGKVEPNRDGYQNKIMLEESESSAMQETFDGPKIKQETSLQSDKNPDTMQLQKEENITGVSESVPSPSKIKPNDALSQSQNGGSVTVSHAYEDNVIIISSSSPRMRDTEHYHQVVPSNEFAQPQAEETSDSINTSKPIEKVDVNKVLIDTAAPFESVKSAVSKFGGIVDWKSHKVQTVERRALIEQELAKALEEIPMYKKQSQVAEDAKIQVLKDLDSTKRLVEELKHNLERAQTEVQNAKQDSDLAKVRVEEVEKGNADEDSMAAKAQLEVARARHAATVSELKTLKDELKELRTDFAMLVTEKDLAVKRAEAAVAASKEVEKTIEELTIELITTKESLESVHAAHLEAEEQRIGVSIAREQDTLNWEKELKESEEELERLNQKISSAKDLKSKLDTASSLLMDLKAELAAYMKSKLEEENDNEGHSKGELAESDKMTHADIPRFVSLAAKELEETKLNIEKASTEVNCLKVAATTLKSELEEEKSALAAIRLRQGLTLVAVSSLEAELSKTKSKIAVVQMRQKEARAKMVELPKQLQAASQEADQAKSLVQIARGELLKAKEEAEQEKAGASTMENRLIATRKEIEATKISEKLALAAINALKESESAQNTNDEDSPTGVMLSLEEYYKLRKLVCEAEEKANKRVATAISQIEVAKESELRSLKKFAEVNNEMDTQKAALEIAKMTVEKAKEGKLGAEQELRKWRAEHEQQRKASESGHGATNPIQSPGASFKDRKQSKIFVQVPDTASHVHQRLSPRAYVPASNNETDSSHKVKVANKKKSFFPRFLMFLAKKKAKMTKSM